MTTLRTRAQDVLSWLADQGLEAFTVDDLVEGLGLARDTARDVARRMARANQILRLRKGLYLVLEANYWNRPGTPLVTNWHAVAAYLAAPGPYYLAYYTAMELHRMLQHPLLTVTVATTEQKPAVKIAPVRFRFVKLTLRKFFGYEQRQLERGKAVNVADLERTFVDCADRLELCGGLEEVVRGFARRHDDLNPERLLRYMLQLDQPVTTKRLGFLLETVGHGDSKLMWELEEMAGRLRNYTPLVPGRPTAGADRSRRWELVINADRDRLLETARA